MTKHPPLTKAEHADWEERSAIMEFDGNMTRRAAEAAALSLVLKARTLPLKVVVSKP